MAQYIRNDCEQGFITDSAEIENLKFNNMRHTVLGCMLGDFDADGNYVVDPEIVEELIAMPKYIVDTVDNIDVCSSVIKLDRQITFFVTYEGEHAVLTLAEKVNFQANFKTNSGLFSNINEYVLDSYETSGVIDKNAVYSKWHISPYSGMALDVFNMDEETLAKYFGIVNRFKYLMKANQIMLENEDKIEEIESNYAVQMIELIARYPALKKMVDEKLKEVVSKQPSVIRLDKPFFAKTVNEVINQTIETNVTVLKPEEKQEFELERRNLIVEQNVKLSQVIDVINAPVLDEKQETITTKCVLNTNGVERRQSLTDVAAEYIVAKNKINTRIVQQAVAETLSPTVRDKFIASTGTKISIVKQKLIDAIAVSTGQTAEQLGKKIVDTSTNDVVSTITKKHSESQTNLVARAAGVDATAEATKTAGADKKASGDKKAGGDKKKAAAKKAGDKKGASKDKAKTVLGGFDFGFDATEDEPEIIEDATTAEAQHAADTLANARALHQSDTDKVDVAEQLGLGLDNWEKRGEEDIYESVQNQNDTDEKTEEAIDILISTVLPDPGVKKELGTDTTYGGGQENRIPIEQVAHTESVENREVAQSATNGEQFESVSNHLEGSI